MASLRSKGSGEPHGQRSSVAHNLSVWRKETTSVGPKTPVEAAGQLPETRKQAPQPQQAVSCLSTVYLLLAHAYSQAVSTCQELLPARHPPPTPVCRFGLKGPRVLHLTVQGLLKGQAGGYTLTPI